MGEEARRGRGRPPLADGAMIQTALRFTAEQLDWLDAEAARAGRIGRNAVIRRLINEAMAK